MKRQEIITMNLDELLTLVENNVNLTKLTLNRQCLVELCYDIRKYEIIVYELDLENMRLKNIIKKLKQKFRASL